MKKKYIIILMVLIIIVTTYLFLRPNLRDFSVLDTSANKLMIVAHPDDEVMWAFSELINDDYLVICITCGSNYKRVNEFQKVMKYTNDEYIMLNYPDKENGERSNWNNNFKDIRRDLTRIIEYKDWNIIVTHNPKGEYGHIQHIITSNIVTSISNKDNLVYFGKYYKKNNLNNNLIKINSNLLDKKKYVINNIYKTQKRVLDSMSHMYPYENLLSYKEWNDEYE